MRSSFLFIAILFSLALISCKKEIVKPELQVDTPLEGSTYNVGESFEVKASSLDDVFIEQYKVQMVLTAPSEFADSTYDGTQFGLHSYMYISPEGYNADTIQHIVPLEPDFHPGTYNLIVSMLTDQYQESKDTVPVRVYNPTDTVQPEVYVFMPAPAYPDYNKQDTLKLIVVATDKRSSLADGKIKRVKVDLVPQFTGQTAVNLVNALNPVSDTVRANFIIPITYSTGNYSVQIVVNDDFNNFYLDSPTITVQ
jgi:hypothetical protein